MSLSCYCNTMWAVNVEKKSCENCNIFLYFSVITANLATYSLGVAYAWSSPAIPTLKGQIHGENPLNRNITDYEESWIASLVALGSALSAFISGILADRIGRKNTLLLSSLPTIMGFSLLAFGNTISYMYAGRFLCGLGCGPVFTIVPIYVGEISEKANRGTLGCFFTFFITVGNLFIYIMGALVTLKTLTIASLVVPTVFLLIFGIFAPESPYYYAKKNKILLAEKSLLKLRRNNKNIVEEELSIIMEDVQTSFAKKITLQEVYQDKAVIKGFTIAFGLVFFQQWSGINLVFFYMQSLFEETGNQMDSKISVIIAGIVQFISSASTLFLADRFGRRLLLLTSATGNALTLFMTGIFFYLKEYTNIDVNVINWLPVVTLNLFIVSYTLGFGPIIFAMIGELFRPHVKAMSATSTIFIGLFSTFCLTNLYPYLRSFMGIGLSFCLLGLICSVGFIFIYVKVPETKGKTLQDIQKLLGNKK